MKNKINLKSGVRRLRMVNEQGPLLVLATLIGIIGGFVALGFHSALEYLNHNIYQNLSGEFSLSDFPRWLFWLIPTLGGLLSGYIVFKFAPETAGHGTDAMINTFHNRGGKVRKRVPFIKAFSSLITISSGGSAGYEGPVAQVGSGLGALVTRLFNLHPKNRRILTLAGTAAGLGAIFKSPLGGALTSVEVLYKEDFESDAFMTSITASVVAYITYCTFSDYQPVFGDLPLFSFNHIGHIFFFSLFGLVCAPASWAYVKCFYSIKNQFDKLSIPRIYKPAIGGLFVGCLFYIEPRILGGGWKYLTEIMELGSTTYSMAFGLILLAIFKSIATSFTVGSGGSGGVFGPSMFVGGMLGGAYGIVLRELFPTIAPEPGALVMIGMGAFFAGAANAPIASVIMVCELTGNYQLLAPLMLSSVVHLYLSKNWSIYENQVHNKFFSKAHRVDLKQDLLKEMQVSQLIVSNEKKPMVTVCPECSMLEMEPLLADTTQDIFPVVNSNERMIGLLNAHNIRKTIFNKSCTSLIIAEDIMESPYFLKPTMDLHLASQLFLRYGALQMVVCNEKKEPQLLLRPKEIFEAYDTLLKKTYSD